MSRTSVQNHQSIWLKCWQKLFPLSWSKENPLITSFWSQLRIAAFNHNNNYWKIIMIVNFIMGSVICSFSSSRCCLVCYSETEQQYIKNNIFIHTHVSSCKLNLWRSTEATYVGMCGHVGWCWKPCCVYICLPLPSLYISLVSMFSITVHALYMYKYWSYMRSCRSMCCSVPVDICS